MEIPLQTIVVPYFARVRKKQELSLANVCKVVIFSEPTKQSALKDAEKFALFCHPLCRYVNTFYFTAAKVTQSFEINKCIREE